MWCAVKLSGVFRVVLCFVVRILRRCLIVLGVSWVDVWSFWKGLRGLWGGLGHLLGHLGLILGYLGGVLEDLEGILGDLEAVLGRLGLLGSFLSQQGGATGLHMDAQRRPR